MHVYVKATLQDIKWQWFEVLILRWSLEDTLPNLPCDGYGHKARGGWEICQDHAGCWLRPRTLQCVDLEMIILREVGWWKTKTSCDITYMWNLKKKGDTNELVCRTDSQTLKNLWLPMTWWWWGGWTGGLGLAYAHWGICNDWPVETCCIAQRPLPNILWSPMW